MVTEMKPVGKSKVSKQTSKEDTVYPLIRLPQEYEGLIGNTVTIYETEHDGQRALLLVPYEDTRSPPKIDRPNSKISINKRLSSIEADIKVIKETLKVD
jgi:hypothetical protein